jgi:hypothetical protein
MALESFQRGLQVWFRPCPDQRSGREAMMSQSPGSPKPGQFRGSPGKKCHLGASVAERHKEYYREDGGDTSPARAVVCHVSPS